MNGLNRYLIGISLLLAFYLLAQFYKPKPTDWTTSYLKEDKIPFGTYILHQHLNDIFPAAKIEVVSTEIYSTLKRPQRGTFNYLLIAEKIKVGKLDFQQMVISMRAGNQIFIAASAIEGTLLRRLDLQITSDINIKLNPQSDAINFVNPSLRSDKGYRFEKNITEYYFSRIDTSRAIVLGERKQGQANFVKYQFGKGALYILPNPKLLSNYSLLKNQGLDYASKALSYLPKTGRLVVDEYFTRPSQDSQSVLRVLFEHEPLRWAYYLSICSLLIFVLFEIKRRQRIIPIIDRLKNTTVEFVKVVGGVYYQQRDNRDIAEKKVSYLLEHIRSKYRLKTTELDVDFQEAVVNISGAEPELVEQLFQEMKYLKAGHIVKDDQLIRLNKLIEQFYKQDQ